MVALDTQLSDSRDGSSSNILGRAEHPSTSGRLPTPDALLVDFQQRGDLRGADPFTDRYFVRSTGLAIFLKVANSPKHDGFVPDRSTASFIVNLHTLQIFADRSDLLQVEQPCQSSDITPTLAIATRQSSCRASQYRCRSIGHVPSSGPTSSNTSYRSTRRRSRPITFLATRQYRFQDTSFLVPRYRLSITW